jgi:FKBP-type peptidyl-prolyl cis-trans isomerase
VTQGLDAAIARMRPGVKWIVIVPSELGYPLLGYYPFERPGEPRFHVSPNTLLIYDVEIIG